MRRTSFLWPLTWTITRRWGAGLMKEKKTSQQAKLGVLETFKWSWSNTNSRGSRRKNKTGKSRKQWYRSEAESVTVEGNNQNPLQDVGPYCDEQANGGINLYLSSLTFISREDKRGKKLIRWASVRLGNSHKSAETVFKPHFSISSPLLSVLYGHLKDSTVEEEKDSICKCRLLLLSSSPC